MSDLPMAKLDSVCKDCGEKFSIVYDAAAHGYATGHHNIFAVADAQMIRTLQKPDSEWNIG